MSKFYDKEFDKLMSTKDINGKTPEIFISTGNRSRGKTTRVMKYAVDNFLKDNKKFCLLYKFNNELKDVHKKAFATVTQVHYPELEFTSQVRDRGSYIELFCNKQPCGYAVAINSSEKVKKASNMMSDTSLMIYDEFATESGQYCPDEISKFQSIHTSLARDKDKHVKYLPVIMISNFVSLLNPYYTELDIATRLKSDTKILRGDGFVLQQEFNTVAAQEQAESAFNRAFKNSNYYKYNTELVYLKDNRAFVEKITGDTTYLATIKDDNKEYALRYTDEGLIYCDDRVDKTFPLKYSVNTRSHNIGYQMIRPELYLLFKRVFQAGNFRFKNLLCKNAVIHLLQEH